MSRVRISFLSVKLNNIPLPVLYYILHIHWFVDGQVGYARLLATVDDASMSMRVRVPAFSSLEHVLGSRIPGSCGDSVVHVLPLRCFPQ